MIEKLKILKSIDWDDTDFSHIKRHIIINDAYEKINELVDAVNELKNRIDPPSVYQVMKDKDAIIGKHIGEKQRLQDELDRTRKALEIIKKEMSKETMPDFAVIRDALKGVGDE